MPKLTVAPRVEPLVLRDLTEAEGGVLQAHESFEALRFATPELDGRDLAGITLLECELVGASAHETDWRAASFIETRFERLDAPVFSAPRSRLREVEVSGSRLGSAEFFESGWQSVQVAHCKLGYLNLRGAVLEDVLFRDCTIDELDLADARATRVSFENCEVRSLQLTRAALRDVDLRSLEIREIVDPEGLRGATLDSRQIAELAAVFAAQLGIRVEG